MQNYHDVIGSFALGGRTPFGAAAPPGGCTNNWYDDMSWYFGILPFFEQTPIYNAMNFNLISSSPANYTARGLKINTLGCPSTGMDTDEVSQPCWSRIRCNYAVNFGNSDFGQESGITDPLTGTTIVFKGRHSHWARRSASAPSPMARQHDDVGRGDLTNRLARLGWTHRRDPDRDWRADLRGHLHAQREISRPCGPAMPDHQPERHLRMHDHRPGGRGKSQVFITKSKHPGGVNVGFCDGSVHFIKNTISLVAFRSLATSQGNDPVGGDSY